jgi:hypothetical protein
MEDARNLIFFENWFDMAEGRDTDEKRLAFYDAIMRYAFEGSVPPKPVKGVSHGKEWAAWDAYNLVRTTIRVRQNKAFAGRLGGLAGRGERKARFGNANALRGDITQAETQARHKQNASETQAETQARSQAETQAINKNKIKNIYIAGSGDPAHTLSRDGLRSLFENFWSEYPSSCPRKVDKKKCLDKWMLLFRDAKDPQALFSEVMKGLARWKRSFMWTDKDGQYIKAPLVWLNGSCWQDAPRDVNASSDPVALPKPVKVTPTDWLLCAERCAHCGARGPCGKGRKIPPPLLPRPTPPEECPDFAPKEG